LPAAGVFEIRREARRRARTACADGVHRQDGRIRHCPHRRVDLRRDRDLLPEGLQVTRGAAGVGAVLCLSGALASQAAESRLPAIQAAHRPGFLYFRSPATVKRLALEYDAIAADVYWIRALQHFGREPLAAPPS